MVKGVASIWSSVEDWKSGRLIIRGPLIEDYVLFDCPGQVELFTHHESLRNIFFRIQKFGYRVRHSLSPSQISFRCYALLIRL